MFSQQPTDTFLEKRRCCCHSKARMNCCRSLKKSDCFLFYTWAQSDCGATKTHRDCTATERRKANKTDAKWPHGDTKQQMVVVVVLLTCIWDKAPFTCLFMGSQHFTFLLILETLNSVIGELKLHPVAQTTTKTVQHPPHKLRDVFTR